MCFYKFLLSIFQMLPIHTNIKEAYSSGQDQEQNFIQNLALFLCTFLKEHAPLVEKNGSNEDLLKVNRILFKTYSFWITMYEIIGTSLLGDDF